MQFGDTNILIERPNPFFEVLVVKVTMTSNTPCIPECERFSSCKQLMNAPQFMLLCCCMNEDEECCTELLYIERPQSAPHRCHIGQPTFASRTVPLGDSLGRDATPPATAACIETLPETSHSAPKRKAPCSRHVSRRNAGAPFAVRWLGPCETVHARRSHTTTERHRQGDAACRPPGKRVDPAERGPAHRSPAHFRPLGRGSRRTPRSLARSCAS